MNGVKVDIDKPIKPIFDHQMITLAEILEKDVSQEVMEYILDTLRFYKISDEGWICTMDYGTITKLSILQNYPDIVDEFEKFFGKEWIKSLHPIWTLGRSKNEEQVLVYCSFY